MGKRSSYYLLPLDGIFKESSQIFKPMPFIEQHDNNTYLDQLLVKAELIKKKRPAKVIINSYHTFSASPADCEEIASIIEGIGDAGIETIFYAKEYGEKELYLAAASKRAVIAPDGFLHFFGFSTTMPFVKRLADKLGIEVEVYRRGKYKGAMDLFRVDKIDPATEEAYGKYYEVLFNHFITRICRRRGKERADIDELINGKVLTAQEAQDQGWIDDVDYINNLIDGWKEEKRKPLKLKVKRLTIGPRWRGRKKRIALLFFDGAIVDTHNQKRSLFGQAIGDIDYTDEIRKLRVNKRIAGVVFRINSPGGSASASAHLAEELLKLKEKKPLFVSQGGVAGSGGYFLSYPGDKIFSHTTTITGSIGVIGASFYFKAVYDKIGLTHSTLKKGPHADLFSVTRRRSDIERAIIDGQIEAMYQNFITRVSSGRKMSINEVDKIGQGRIWSGEDAKELGLVDETGGLLVALKAMGKELGVKKITAEIFPKLRYSFFEKALLGGKKETTLSFPPEMEHLLALINTEKGNLLAPSYLMPETLFFDIRV
ncbi:signal peptide peptidase SppA [Candidatus Acetothermia bacterium]|jgi:protease-4|nr:signal peptide peptidase SppA [Candidatus Acetothermia bacterium]MCI2428983.1 signal peptide peptidase SppA [Candidatus Acetothermia bacterium]